MANRGGSIKVKGCESAIHDNRSRASGFATKFAGEQRDAHSLEITGGDKAILGDDFRLRFSAPFEQLDFSLVSERHSGHPHRDGGRVDTRRGAKCFEHTVSELAKLFQVAGFPIVHAELEGKDVAGIESTRDSPKLLKAAQKQAGTGQQGDRKSYPDADKEPFRGISSEYLCSSGLRKGASQTAAGAANRREQSANKSYDNRTGE